MALFVPALAWAQGSPAAVAIGAELARRRYPRFRGGTGLLGACCCLIVVLVIVAIVVLVRRWQRRPPPQA